MIVSSRIPAGGRAFLLACALSSLLPARALAFRLEPMVLSVPVSEARAAGTYTVENTTPAKVAVEFQMKERIHDLEGVETRPAAQGFLVYPQQLKLEPGEKRSVRITWAGASVPATEKAFRLVATQLPVNFESDQAAGTNIRFLLEYVASFYLTPKGAKGKLKVVDQAVGAKGALEIRINAS
ncbi:MAG: hypothetical protein EOP11_00385 [Proteobacteria bacterium]|nr:MAG: hypothetical protein EOP11_00385 [Pseudomonadota bacterium]